MATFDGTSTRPLQRFLPWLIGAPLLLALVAIFGAGIHLKREIGRRLAEAIAAADADDPNWRIADLIAHREPVPDGENSALVVDKVLALLPGDWSASATTSPGGVPQSPQSELKQSYERLIAISDNILPSKTVVDGLRHELENREEAIRLARTLADYDRGRHEVKLGPGLVPLPPPETPKTYIVAQILAIDAAIRAFDGDIDGALDSCRAILGVARSIGDEPFIVSQLVRTSIGETAARSVRKALGQGEPSDEALARLQAALLDEQNRPLFLYAMEGERASAIEAARRLGSGKSTFSGLIGDTSVDAKAIDSVLTPQNRLQLDEQMATLLEWTNEAVAIARGPGAERWRRWEGWGQNIERASMKRSAVARLMLPFLLTLTARASGDAYFRYEAKLRATAILIAAERHRRETGAWPISIAKIDRKILPVPPIDPFSGGPFRMERVNGQFAIRSMDPNPEEQEKADTFVMERLFRKKGILEDPPDARAWDVARRRQPPPAAKAEGAKESAPPSAP